jgi:capsular exopolysaccharide synthesis family protein
LLRRLDWPGADARPGVRTLGVTSCYRGEGVSTVAAQLAATAATCDSRRVLLVDANLAQPALHRILDLHRAPGLAEAVVDGEDFFDCLQETGMENLWAMTAGEQPGSEPVYDSGALAGLIGAVREEFDLTVFDLPAAGEASAAVRLASLLDGAVLVVESERVRREVARRVVDQFAQADARLFGAVLNKRQQHVPDWLYRTL